MPSIKKKTHKGVKKRFKVTATGKVLHKRCGSSHLNSHKSGERIRKLRKKSVIRVGAVARRLRRALGKREGSVPENAHPVEMMPMPTAPAESGAAETQA